MLIQKKRKWRCFGNRKEAMIMKKLKRSISIFAIMIMLMTAALGCGRTAEEEPDDNVLSDNIILTETGETLILPQESEQDSPHEQLSVEEPEAETQSVQKKITLPDAEVDVPHQEQVITEEDQIEPHGSELQIVFLGDSIFDSNRDGTGVPYLTAKQCNDADFYNLAIGGTSAALEDGESVASEECTSWSLVGVVKVLNDDVSSDAFAGLRVKDILDNPDVDFSNTDYFVVEYGINDFFQAVPLDNAEYYYDHHTYAGALRYSISNLQEISPDATVILCGPHYCQFFNGKQFIGDGNVLHNGYGTLFDYKGISQYVAKEQQVVFFDAYMDLGIDGYTAEEYLEDGVHLTEAGRQLYADALAKIIMDYEETKNN